MAFAAIWQAWTNPADQARWVTVALSTTAANAEIADIHHREPVSLSRDEIEPWLRGTPADALALTGAADLGYYEWYRVGQEVNSARHDRPELMAPLD